MKHLYIETYGCQMNVADSEVVASVMRMAGYEPTEKLEEADAVLLNTCSVRENAEQKIVHRLEQLNALRRRRPLIIGVLGCMAERVKGELIERHGVDLVAGPDLTLYWRWKRDRKPSTWSFLRRKLMQAWYLLA